MAINNDRKQIIKSFKIYINTYLLHICVVLNYIYEDKDRIVTKEDISEAIKYLESGKFDGDKGLVSYHLLMNCEEVKIQLGKLTTAIAKVIDIVMLMRYSHLICSMPLRRGTAH